MTNKAITVAFDLDECLAHTFEQDPDGRGYELLHDTRSLVDLRDRLYVLDYYDSETQRQEHYVGVRRPYVDHVLKSVAAEADIVIVYTASEAGYAYPLVQALWEDRGIPPPQYIFTRDSCYYTPTEMVKPLVGILESEPELKARTSMDRIIMLDDRESNFALNKSNGLVIPPYQPEPTIEGIRQEDRMLLVALEEIRSRIRQIRHRDGLERTAPVLRPQPARRGIFSLFGSS